jgi:hypothetical protein
MLLYLLGVVGCILLGVQSLSSAGFAVLVYFFLAAGIPAFGFIRNWTRPVRRAKFYEDRFQIVGGGIHRELDYSDVISVSLENRFQHFLYPLHVRIRINSGEDFLVPGNPKNRKLRTDLCSWLIGKVDGKVVKPREV